MMYKVVFMQKSKRQFRRNMEFKGDPPQMLEAYDKTWQLRKVWKVGDSNMASYRRVSDGTTVQTR